MPRPSKEVLALERKDAEDDRYEELHSWSAYEVLGFFAEIDTLSAQLEAATTALRACGRVCKTCGGFGSTGRFDTYDCPDCIDGYPIDIARCIPELAPRIDLPFVGGRRT